MLDDPRTNENTADLRRIESSFVVDSECVQSLSISLARVGEDDDGPVIVFISESLDQMNQVRVLHLLWSQDVSLVQLFHRSCSENSDEGEFIFIPEI